ncbi:helix-turn-helix domain-containing protein [uncultured Kordia sp.]|uniref:helix-turn-helix domain-containing protein n=1 Tax=uncultured Kordia sp. TaxID=507699 RepID=UPI002622CAFD|nr:helix-turn-helix domain-containing protein [uncultured Kordia sp.]
MIPQPALGKKIAEFRKVKGFTQEQLVEKCNLNVRTLQRIEAGEVTPRTSTIKLIFEALEIDFESATTASVETNATTENHAGKLLNFKTNSMKKFTLIFLPILLSLIAMFMVMRSPKRTYDDSNVKRSDITEASTLNMRYFNSGQFDSVATLYLENAHFMPTNHRELVGRAEIIEYVQDVYESGFRMVMDKSTFVVISDSIAVERGIWKGNNSGVEFSGTYLTQWKLHNGSWFMENHMTNTNP